MAEFDFGQTFLDKQATNFSGTKGKYYIALSNADYDDDLIICFVMNTEKFMDKYQYNCNKSAQKFIIAPNTFSFIDRDTSIMLDQPVCYKFIEMYGNNIKLLDQADETLCRQIKNCIDFNNIPPKFATLIKDCFKQ